MIPYPVAVILIVAQSVAPLLCTATSGTYVQFMSRSPKCGTNEPVKSFKVRSRVQCISECQHRTNQHQQQQQLSPCVGVNYRDTEAACDVFDQEPTSYSTTTPGCQYFGLQWTSLNNQPLFSTEVLAVDNEPAVTTFSATTKQATSVVKTTTSMLTTTTATVTASAATTKQATSVAKTTSSIPTTTATVKTSIVATAQRTRTAVTATTIPAKVTTTQFVMSTTAASPARVLIQNYDGNGAFNRLWSEFKSGFNDSVGNFWLGSDMISNLTLMTSCNKLTFELQSSSNGKWYVANYDSFIVYNETLSYRMYVSGYSGNASYDALAYQSGMMFTTKDRDYDTWGSNNCAIYEGGGFWYNNCADAHVANTINVGKDFIWRNLPPGSKLSRSRMWLVCG